MKYDIRINNVFFREIEGKDIESALNNAGIDVDFTETGHNRGYIHYDDADIIGILSADTDRDVDELLSEVRNCEKFEATFGPAE